MSQNALRARFLRWEWLLVVLIAVVTIINARLSPFFLNGNNLLRTTSDFMEIGILMLPMVFIIITGNIDLSIASTRGLAYALLGDQAARGYPPSFTYLGQGTLGDTRIPFALLVFTVLAVVFGLILHKTTFGRYLYAIGSNEP